MSVSLCARTTAIINITHLLPHKLSYHIIAEVSKVGLCAEYKVMFYNHLNLYICSIVQNLVTYITIVFIHNEIFFNVNIILSCPEEKKKKVTLLHGADLLDF